MLFTWVRAVLRACLAHRLRWALAASLLAGAAIAGALPFVETAASGGVVGLSRGPYLQLGSETEVRVIWGTDRPAGTRVDYGEEGYTDSIADPRPVTRHEMALRSLRPGTRYVYRVVSGGRVLREGMAFTTHKAAGRPFRFAVFGDSGSGEKGQYLLAERLAAARPDFVLHTGDVVYPSGAQEGYNARFFRPYARLLESVVLWPTPGNHDWMRARGRAYFDNFVLPHNGPAGVAPERNYTFDYADAHFVSIDSNQSDAVLSGKVAPWLKQDLASTGKRWRFVFFHHPPYSTGLHGESKRVQRLLVPTLSRGKVDVVFNGHDHTYERIRETGGVTYIITGAGGGGLYKRKHPKPYTARFYNRLYSFTLVDVEGSRVSLQQIAMDGTVVDRVELVSRSQGAAPSP